MMALTLVVTMLAVLVSVHSHLLFFFFFFLIDYLIIFLFTICPACVFYRYNS